MRQNLKINILRSLLCSLLLLPTLGRGASAQQYLSPGYVFTEVTKGLGFQPMPESPPDFVVKARPDPATLDYTALKPPPHDFHSESAKVVTRLQAESGTIAELESARSANQKAGAKAGSSPQGSAAASSPETADPTKNWSKPWSDD